MSVPSQFDDDDRWLAAEYALGVLDGARLAQAERRVAEDDAFRVEVAEWTAHLAPMLLSCSPEQPSPEVWASIRARLDAERGPMSQARRSRPQRLWNDVRVWRATTLGALALAAASWVVSVTPQAQAPRPAPVGRTPVLAASLSAQAGRPLFAVMVDRDRAQIAVVPLYAWNPERSRQLWLIPADGTPRSLGLILPGHPTPLALPPELRGQARESVTFAVSDEPAGGSPSTGPSGQVLAKGALTAL